MVPLDAESLERLQRGPLSFPCSHPPSNAPVVKITVCAMVGGSWPRVREKGPYWTCWKKVAWEVVGMNW